MTKTTSLKMTNKLKQNMKLVKAKMKLYLKSKKEEKIKNKKETTDKKVEKIKRLVNKGEYDKDMARYILGVLNFNVPGYA